MWGTPEETERRNRIKLSVAAYAYEFDNTSIMSDAEFDEFARLIDPQMSTNNQVLDQFFRTEFQPDTGQWIHKHPELDKVKQLYLRVYRP
jgi:biotin synthase-related radical SAM superfamily protein